MNQQIQSILESLLLNVDVLNDELARLARCEQFTPTSHSFQLIERIRGSCMCSLKNIRTVERSLHLKLPPPPAAEIVRLPGQL